MPSYVTPTTTRVHHRLASDEPSPTKHARVPYFPPLSFARRDSALGLRHAVTAVQSVFDESRVQALEMIFVALLQATIIPNQIEPRHLLRVL